MGNSAKSVFDAQDFLAKVGAGKSILEFEKNENVFAQGDIADTVFYIQRARSNSRSYPSTTRRLWSGFWGRANSSAKAA
jgi:hypothetical protein